MLTAIVSASELPKDADLEVFEDWSGGLNTVMASHKLPANQSPDMKNVFIDEKIGSIVTIRGYETAATTATLGKINFMLEFTKDDGTSEFLVSDSSLLLTTNDFSNFTLLKSGLTTTARLRGKQIRKKVWICDGINSPFTYDGSTLVVLNGSRYGTLQVPNVPKGAHIEYWSGTVWIGNTTDDVTELAFAAVETTDTVPIAIAPDSEWAWRSTLKLYIGRGDGEPITALFVDGSQLKIGKTGSIWTMFGTDASSFKEFKTNEDVGIVSNFSISGLDDLTYFVGQNNADFAVYAFDSQSAVSVSELIRNRIEDASSDQNKIVSDVWDDRTDWNKGTHYNSTVPVNQDYLTILTTVTIKELIDPAGEAGPLDFGNYRFTATGSSTTQYSTITAVNPLPLNYSGRLSSVTFQVAYVDASCSGVVEIRFVFRDTNTFIESNAVVTKECSEFGSAPGITITTPIIGNLNVATTALSSNSIMYKCVADKKASSNFDIRVSSIGIHGAGGIVVSTNTASFVSNVATASTITAWESFTSNNETNQGSLNFYVKTASSVVNTTTETWTSIVSGNNINSNTSKNRVQWTTTMTATNLDNPPRINNVTIRHNEGTASLGLPFGITWKGRYLLFVSTQSDGSSFTGYWKAKSIIGNPQSWMYIDGYPIFSVAEYNGNLYGGGDGKIYQLDTGTNFDGSAINSHYQTPYVAMKTPFFDKILSDYIMDVEKKSGRTIDIGLSVDGSSFTSRNIDIDGSGRLIKTLQYPNETGNLFSWKFSNSELDKGLEFHRFGVIYSPTRKKSGD